MIEKNINPFIVINLFCQKCSVEWPIEKAGVVPSTDTDLLECPVCQSYLAEVTKPFAGLNLKKKLTTPEEMQADLLKRIRESDEPIKVTGLIGKLNQEDIAVSKAESDLAEHEQNDDAYQASLGLL